MPTLRFVQLTPQVLLRVVADVLLINSSALAALALRFLYLVAFEPPPVDISYNHLFWAIVSNYLHVAWLLTAICLSVFSLSGFYTRGRAYQGRYKALVVTQAVSLAYLLFGFIAYFLGGALDMPRAALLLAWAVSVAALVLSRVWAVLWSNLVRAEINLEKPPAKGVARVLVIGGAGYIGGAVAALTTQSGRAARYATAVGAGVGSASALGLAAQARATSGRLSYQSCLPRATVCDCSTC